MSDSPHEYVEKLRVENRALRRSCIEMAAQLEKFRIDMAALMLQYLRLEHAARPL